MSNTTSSIEDYQRIYDLTLQYQAGDNEAAYSVIESFTNYLNGFIILLRGGQVKNLSYSHRLFMSAFVKNGGLGRSLRSGKPATAAYHAGEAAILTISIQLRPIEQEDLLQEVYEVFLGTLRRYKSRDNQNFLIPYIYKSFPYALVRRVKSLIKDPLVNLASDKILPIESFNDTGDYDKYINTTSNQHISSKDIVKHLTTSYEKAADEIDYDQLGHQWIVGDICDEVFDCLTDEERWLIKSFYFLQKTDAKIADEMGVSYNTAVRRRYHIESKIKGLYVSPTCKWCGSDIAKAKIGRQPRQCDNCKKERRNKKNAEQ